MGGILKKSIILIAVRIVFVLGAFLLILTSCATTPITYRKGWYNEEVERLKIVQKAEELIGTRDLKKINSVYRNDCSGFVIGLYRSLGYRIKLNRPHGSRYTLSQLLFINLRKRGLIYMNGIPKKADLVFFKGTVRTIPNRISHVGIVDDILGDRTIVVIHYGSKGVARLRMNLLHPYQHLSRNGRVLNDFIIKKSSSRNGMYLLSAEHFAGFGDLYSYSMKRSGY